MTYCILDCGDDCWTEGDRPLRFESEEDAQDEIESYLSDHPTANQRRQELDVGEVE